MMQFPDQCVCQNAGHCEAVGRIMSPGMHKECRSNPKFRLMLAKVPLDDPRWTQETPATSRGVTAKPPRPRPPCIYLGDYTGEVQECKTCAGSVHIKLQACVIHGKCTIGKKLDGVACCAACNERCDTQPAKPSEIVAIPSTDDMTVLARFDEHNLAVGQPHKRFNASIVAADDGYILAYRDGWKGSDIFTVRLDAELQPAGEPSRLTLKHNDAGYGREDPRLFWHRGRLHISFIGVVGTNRPNSKRIKHTNQLFARLTPDGRGVEDLFSPVDYPYGRRAANARRWQKNWQFFDHAGQLYAVYTIRPHVVLKIDSNQATPVSENRWEPGWQGGEPRGGAAPVLVDDEWYCFFHDRVVVNGLRTYRMGVYTFDAAPPFAPRRMTPEPILVADPATKPADQYAAVVFPGGAVYRQSDWLIAMGVHDRWTELWRFDAAWIEERLGGFAEPAGVDGLSAVGYNGT